MQFMMKALIARAVPGRHVLLRLAGVMAALLAVPAPLRAQAVPDAVSRDLDRILEQQQQQFRMRAQEFGDGQRSAPTGAEIPAEEAPVLRPGGCAAISQIRIQGMTRYGEREFSAVINALKGPCVGVEAIDAALRAITNRYVEDGFITSRAFVGPQDLKSGTLTITVIEGRLSAIRSGGDKGYGQAELDAAFAGATGGILNLRALEQGVDQLARMAKAEPSIDIAPAATRGASDVVVLRKPQAFWLRPSGSFNNDGSASTGRLQAGLGLDVDSLFGVADVWSFYYQRNASSETDRGNEAYGAFVSVPYGWWTFSLSAGASTYHSLLVGNDLSFETNGRSQNASLVADRMLFRDARTKLTATAALSLLDTRNSIQGIRLRTSSYRIVSASLGTRLQRRAGRSLLSASLSYERGLDILGAETVDTGPGGATGLFNLIGADLMLQSVFDVGGLRLTNLAMVRGQWGLDNLFPAQRFSLGGRATVRGFRDDGLSGRTGALFREQIGAELLTIGRSTPAWQTVVSGYVAYDAGGIAPRRGDPFERGVLQSATLGLRAQGPRIQSEVALSLPISAPDFVNHKSREIAVSLRISL